MQIKYTSNYRMGCIVIEPGDEANDVIDMAIQAIQNGVFYFDGDEEMVVVDFQNGGSSVGPEAYTLRGLRERLK